MGVLEARRTYEVVLFINIKFTSLSPSCLPNRIWNSRIYEAPPWKTVQLSKIYTYLKTWKKCWMSESSPSRHSAPILEFKEEVLDEPSYKIRVFQAEDRGLKSGVPPTSDGVVGV